MKLADKKCSDGASVPPVKVLRARELLKELGQGWKLNGRGHLVRLLHLQGLRAGAGVCEQGRGCRGGRGPSSRSISGLGEVQDRDLVAQD